MTNVKKPKNLKIQENMKIVQDLCPRRDGPPAMRTPLSKAWWPAVRAWSARSAPGPRGPPGFGSYWWVLVVLRCHFKKLFGHKMDMSKAGGGLSIGFLTCCGFGSYWRVLVMLGCYFVKLLGYKVAMSKAGVSLIIGFLSYCGFGSYWWILVLLGWYF